LFDYSNKSSTITVDCGVDLRLVDPTTGAVAAAEFSEYKKTDTIGAMGIEIIGADAGHQADLKLDSDNKGKVLRLSLDDCLKKMMPKIDRVLLARAKAASTATGSGK
jgi:curli biogenesis system outer membrane secretion channel CsgG